MKRKLKRTKYLIGALFVAALIGGGKYERWTQDNRDAACASYRTGHAILLGSLQPVQAKETPEKTEEQKIEDTTDELIIYYSEKFGVREDLVRCVLKNESNFNFDSVGDSGKAHGMAQFWLGTWKGFRKAMGLSQEDMRFDKAEAIKTLCWALSTGKGNHWSPIKDGRCK